MRLRGGGQRWILLLVFSALAMGEWNDDSCTGTTCLRFDAQDRCTQDSGDFFDLSALRREGLLGTFTDLRLKDVNYFVSVCQNVQPYVADKAMAQTCLDAGEGARDSPVWQTVRKDGEFSCSYLGVRKDQDTASVQAYGKGMSLGPNSFAQCDGDICLTYSNGELGQGCSRPRRVSIVLTCSSEVGEALAYESAEGSCHYLVKMVHPAGCRGAVGMSAGWVFDIMFFLVAFTYVGLGITYKTTMKGYPMGKEAIPNIEFWRSLPGYVRDGITFCKSTVHRRVYGTVPGYDNVT